MRNLICAIAAAAAVTAATTASAQVVIGNFAGGVAEAGWGQFDGSPDFFQPIDGTTVFTVIDLDTSGDGGELETNRPGFSDSFAYDAVQGGTVTDFFANDLLVFDLIYRGDATDQSVGGFNEVFQVSFNSETGGFAQVQGLAAVTQVGFAPGDQPPATVLNVEVDYSAIRDAIPNDDPGGFLQLIWSTNDSNRPFKAIDNVRFAQVPEPASLGLLSVVGLGLIRGRRTR